MNWERVRLGDIVNIRTGKLDANAAVENGEFPFFTCAKEISRIDNYAFDGECVLVAGNGDLNVKYYNGKFNAYQRTYVIQTSNETLDIKYLYYFLEEYLEELRIKSIGGVIKYIKLENLQEPKIPLPPLSVQKEIVEKLDKAAAIREKSKALLAYYDALAESLFIELFGDPISNEKGWEMDDFEKVLSLKRGYDLPIQNRKRDGKYPVYGSNGILDYHDSYKMQDPCIITGRSGTIGLIHKSTKPCWPLNTSLYSYKINGNNIIFLEYLLRFFRVERFSHGAGVPTLDRNLVHKEKLPQIPLSLQVKFAEMVENIEEQKARAKAEIEQSEAVFQALLQESFG
jgi:type I restriction modification enzyme protein S